MSNRHYQHRKCSFNLPQFFYRQVANSPTASIEKDGTFRIGDNIGGWSGVLKASASSGYLYAGNIQTNTDLSYFAGIKASLSLLEASYGCYMIIKY